MEQPVPPGGEPRAPAQAPGAGLRRSADNRLIGGVCGGLAEYTGVDPVVFRVTIAVIALVGGAGVLFYGAAMLLIPDARTGSAPVDRVLHSRQHPRVRVAALLLAIVVGIIVAGGLGGWFGSGSLAIVIVAALAALVAHRRGADLRGTMSRLAGHDTAPQRTAPYAGPAPGVAGPPPAQPPPRAPREAPTTSQYVDLSTLPRPGYVGNGPVSTPPERRPRSITWYVLLAAALVAAAVVLAQQRLGLPGDVRLPLTAALTVLGVGLLLSTWVGRARVTGWGVLLAVALAAMTLVHGIGGGQYLRDVAWRPTTAAQLSAQQPYQADLANARVDLTALPVTDDHTYQVSAQIDAGRLVVTVPRSTRVHVHARCDACRMRVLGQRYAGTDDVRLDRTFPAAANRDEWESGGGDGKPRDAGANVRHRKRPVFDLNLRGDAALVEVRRAA
ncbi:MAG: PspC domain-containing protein [Streptosporangiales bacterium]